MKLFLLAAVAVPSLAQFRSIEIAFQGTGCVSCAESLPERIKRIRGVESATVDVAQGVLKVALAQENRVRIEQIRDMIEQDGTKAKTAIVKVQGAFTQKGGKWILQPPSLSSSYEVQGQVPSKPGNYVVEGEIDSLRVPVIQARALQPQARLRRLNRNEHANTIRDLLNIHINVADVLPWISLPKMRARHAFAATAAAAAPLGSAAGAVCSVAAGENPGKRSSAMPFAVRFRRPILFRSANLTKRPE